MPNVQVQFAPEMTRIFEEIRNVRAAKAEPKTNKQIATDAVKAMYEALCHAPATQSQGM